MLIYSLCLPISQQASSYLQKAIFSMYIIKILYRYSKGIYYEGDYIIDPSKYILKAVVDCLNIYCYDFSRSINDNVKEELACQVDDNPCGSILGLLLKIVTHIIKQIIEIENYSTIDLDDIEKLDLITKTLLRLSLNLDVSHPDYIHIMENLLLITKHYESNANIIGEYLLKHWPNNSVKLNIYYRYFTSSCRIMRETHIIYNKKVIKLLIDRILSNLKSDNMIILQTVLRFIDCESYSPFWDLVTYYNMIFPFVNMANERIQKIINTWDSELKSYAIKIYNILKEYFL